MFTDQINPAGRAKNSGIASETFRKYFFDLCDRGIFVFRSHQRLTPLARKPPSTARTWPVTKLAASDARKTAAPTSSLSFPKRPMGVRVRNSLPRSVPSRRAALSSVRKTPGAMALTQTPLPAHSMASDFVSDATAALLAEYAATSKSATKLEREAIL